MANHFTSKKIAMNTSFHNWLQEQIAAGRITRGGFTISNANAAPVLHSLLSQFSTFTPDSTGLLGENTRVRPKDFRLGVMHSTTEARGPESIAEQKISAYYRNGGNRNLVLLGSNSPVAKIHSYQVPLTATQGDGLGKTDILGMTAEGLPVVIELKVSRGKYSESMGKLLGPILQGLAYSLTLRYFWTHSGCFREEWTAIAEDRDLPVSLENHTTPIVVAADREFWNCGRAWSSCPWSHFLLLSRKLEEGDMPLYVARFESPENPELEFAKFDHLEGSESGKKSPGWPV